MGRKAVPQPLKLPDSPTALSEGHITQPCSAETLPAVSAQSLDSRSSPRTPRSPFSRLSPKRPQVSQTSTPAKPASATAATAPRTASPRALEDYDDEDEDAHQYPPITSALHQPVDTPTRSQHRKPFRHQASASQSQIQSRSQSHPRDERRPSTRNTFFSHFSKASTAKSSISHSSHHQHHHSVSTSTPREAMSGGTDAISSSGKSTIPSSDTADNIPADLSLPRTSPSLPSKSDVSLASTGGDIEPTQSAQSSTKKAKAKSFGILQRSRSGRDKGRDKESPSPQGHPVVYTPTNTSQVSETERTLPSSNEPSGLKTAPLGTDRSFRDMMNSAVRNRSEDRTPAATSSRDMASGRDHRHHGGRDASKSQHLSVSARSESGGFFGGLRNSSTKAAEMIQKNFFGKSMRSGSTTEREPVVDDENYVLKVINLPLVQQTRKTRISKRLEDSKDKTEFWMPAFPWRAIDYLNYKGCDVEGLYRVPGSGPQVKKWQRKFDEELDVDLFVQPDLYDINIVGSMLKAWLRELPDELFPKEAQERVARECAGADKVPQLLIDELSNLSPFNYYLLFAITCHLSLLLSHSTKNKMDFRNLCICFQPCMKIDAFCFKFLVCDWRECWQGCKQEAKFIEQEYALLDQAPPKGMTSPRGRGQQDGTASEERTIDERIVSSSDSNKPSNLGADVPQIHLPQQEPQQPQPTQSQPSQQKGRLKKKHLQLSDSNGSVNSTSSSAVGPNGEPLDQPRDLRPLSPIKPLSPLGF